MIESKETNKKLKVKEYWVMKRVIREFGKRKKRKLRSKRYLDKKIEN